MIFLNSLQEIEMKIWYIIAAFFPAVLIIWLFYYFDKNKEPLKALIRAFILGIMSTFLVVLLYLIIPTFATSVEEKGTLGVALSESFLGAGLHEELAKFLVFLFGISTKKYFDEWYDGILYGVIIGTGFAFIENIQYFSFFYELTGFEVLMKRSIYSMPMHALLGGYGIFCR